MKRAQVQAVDGVADKVRQVALGQSVLQGAWQKLLLLGVVGHIPCTHDPIETLAQLCRISTIPSGAQTPRDRESPTGF